jgi:hypothetical protein
MRYGFKYFLSSNEIRTQNMLQLVHKIFTVSLFILTAEHHLFAQDGVEEKKHSVHIEGFGRSIIWMSFNYEYQIIKNISLGTGFGFTDLSSGVIMNDSNGVIESGRYTELLTSQMIFANYFVGKKQHRLYLTAGLSNFWSWTRHKFDSGSNVFSDAQVRWNAGIGYHYSGQKMYFRLTGYVLRLPEPTGIFPRIAPWVGVSLGYKF